jgi:hypothetical protein
MIENIKDYITGHWLEFLLYLIGKERLALYQSRLENMNPDCKVCPDCGCKMPHLLWVKACPSCEIKYSPIDIRLGEYYAGVVIPVSLNFEKPPKSVDPSCGCTKAVISESNAKLSINTKNQKGPQSKSIIVRFHDGDVRTYRIHYKVI